MICRFLNRLFTPPLAILGPFTCTPNARYGSSASSRRGVGQGGARPGPPRRRVLALERHRAAQLSRRMEPADYDIDITRWLEHHAPAHVIGGVRRLRDEADARIGCVEEMEAPLAKAAGVHQPMRELLEMCHGDYTTDPNRRSSSHARHPSGSSSLSPLPFGDSPVARNSGPTSQARRGRMTRGRRTRTVSLSPGPRPR